MELRKIADVLLSRHERRNRDEKPYSDYKDILDSKESVLGRFQSEFSDDGIEQLSENKFRDFLSFKHNRHWTGLQRPTAHVCDDMPRLRAALKHLFDESVPVSKRLDDLTRDPQISVSGMSIGILSPLLLVRYPRRYGVWNGKSETALKTLRLWPRHDRGTTKGQKYEKLNTTFLKLAGATGLDLWSLDGLWHVINEECRIGLEKDLQEENEEQQTFFEGKKKLVTGIAYERNPKARSECIRHNGTACVACGFDFFEAYGELGLGFIHVHHVSDVASQGETEIDPKKDLVPVCPNCHAMLHRRAKPARSIEELREIIASAERCTRPSS